MVVPLDERQGSGGSETVKETDGAPDGGYHFFSLTPYNPFKWNIGVFDDFHSKFFFVCSLRSKYHKEYKY